MKLSIYSNKWLLIFLFLGIVAIASYLLYGYFNLPEHTNLILITIDTLRADHLGCYGYRENTSPFVDSIAQEGVMFLNAYAQIPLTLPSLTAILTSTHPKTNGVRLNGYCKANDELKSIAEILKEEGYSTYAVIGAFPLDSRFGLSQGFDIYDDKLEEDYITKAKYWHNHKYLRYERKAHEVTNKAAKLLKKIGRKEKFFLWVHYFDPHWRYRPPEKFKKSFTLAYDGEIAFVDSEIRRFFRKLNKRRFHRNSLVIITADHGEGLHEHGEEGHGWELFNTTINIPIIFYYPGILPENLKINTSCQSVDIMPTALEIMGISPPEYIEGISLVQLINGKEEKFSNRAIFAESNKPKVIYGNQTRYSVIHDNYKLIAYYDGKHQAIKYKLFNLKEDPKELNNIVSTHPDLVERLAIEISNFFSPAAENYAFFETNKEIEEKLRALGYID